MNKCGPPWWGGGGGGGPPADGGGGGGGCGWWAGNTKGKKIYIYLAALSGNVNINLITMNK